MAPRTKGRSDQDGEMAQQQQIRSADQDRITDLVSQLVQRIAALEARLQETERACQQQPAIVDAVTLLRKETDHTTSEIQVVARSADLFRDRLDSTDGLATTLNDMITMHENVMISVEGRQRSQEEKVLVIEGLLEQLVDQRPETSASAICVFVVEDEVVVESAPSKSFPQAS